MTEGRIYRCSWKRIPTGYRVWLKSDPSIAAEHAGFEEADELLYERIMEATGDGENQHQYVPPPPDPAGANGRGRLWLLGQAGSVKMSHEPPYFEGGLCDQCVMPLGPRTSLPLEVSRLKGGGNAASVRFLGAGIGVGPSLTIVSERLLKTFTKSERADFEWRPVTGASPRRTFFELVPKMPTTPFVLPAGPGLVAERCEACGFTWSPYYQMFSGPDDSVSEADLPQPARTLVAVDQWPHASLAVTEARWKKLVGQPSLRGIKGSPIPIIAADAVGQPSNSSRGRERSGRGDHRRTPNEVQLVRRRASLFLTVISLSLVACSERASRSLASSFISEREEQYAKDHPEYAERLHQAAQLAAQVKVDSLRTIYVNLLGADSAQRAPLTHEMLCEYTRLLMQYSAPVADRAKQHVMDSLLAQPGAPERWAAAQGQEEQTMTSAGCNFDVPHASDTLLKLPPPNALQ